MNVEDVHYLTHIRKALPARDRRYLWWRATWSLAVLCLMGMVGCGKVDQRWGKTTERSSPSVQGNQPRSTPSPTTSEGSKEDLPSTPPSESPGDELTQLEWRVADYPTSLQARLELAKAYLRLKRLADAAYQYRQALELDARNLEALLGLSTVASQMGDKAGSLLVAQRAVEIHPKNPLALNRLLVAQAEARQPEEAEKTLQKALQLYPNDARLLINAANLAARRRDWQKVEDYCRRAAAAAPNSPDPLLALGNYYLLQSLPGKALEVFAHLAPKFPKDPQVLEAWARAQAAQGQLREARQTLVRAQALSPRWALPYLQAAQLSVRLKEYETAISYFRKAQQLAPGSATVQLGLAEALSISGQQEGAIPVYEELLASHPNHPIALNNLAYLLAESRKDLKRAREMAQQVVDAYPRDGSVRDTLGWIHYQSGNYKQAIAELQQATVLKPKDGRIHYHLGKALLAANRREEAAKALGNALSLPLPPDMEQDARALLANR